MKVLLLFLLSFVFFSTLITNSYGSEILFHVYRNGEKIGYHKLKLLKKDNIIQSEIEIKFEVKFLGFNIYDYFHKNNEVWIDNKFKGLESETNKNGEILNCSISIKDGFLYSDGTHGDQSKLIPMIPTTYWNYKLVENAEEKKVINSQDCSLINLKIKKIGRENIYDKRIWSTHFNLKGKEITGKDLDIDIWYDDNKNWIKMTFIKDSSKIEYFLDKFYEPK